MKTKDILIFLGLLIISDWFVLYVHDQTHKYDEPVVSTTAYDEDANKFELGEKTSQPWGASLFCKESPELCGMN